MSFPAPRALVEPSLGPGSWPLPRCLAPAASTCNSWTQQSRLPRPGTVPSLARPPLQAKGRRLRDPRDNRLGLSARVLPSRRWPVCLPSLSPLASSAPRSTPPVRLPRVAVPPLRPPPPQTSDARAGRTASGVPRLSSPSLPARRWSPLSYLRSWRPPRPPLAASPRPPLTGEGALHPRPEPATVSRAVLVPVPAPASWHAGCELGGHRSRSRRDQCGWRGLDAARPRARPSPRGRAVSRAAQRRASRSRGSPADCVGARHRRSPPPRPGPPQPAIGAPLARPGPSLPACAPSWPLLLSCAQGPCPQTRRSEARATSEKNTSLLGALGLSPQFPSCVTLGQLISRLFQFIK